VKSTLSGTSDNCGGVASVGSPLSILRMANTLRLVQRQADGSNANFASVLHASRSQVTLGTRIRYLKTSRPRTWLIPPASLPNYRTRHFKTFAPYEARILEL
jgi:hypothetical protein